MTSKSLPQSSLLDPNPREELEVLEVEEAQTVKPRRASVYDAVAGRVSAAGFIPKQLTISSTRDTPSSSVLPAAPENVLFRSKKAPTRYAESDLYFQDPLSDLPDSELLKALHCYASDFYSRATVDGGINDTRSLDETALLALGILMEEVCRESLGQTGDLVFTEGEEFVSEKRESFNKRPPSVGGSASSTARRRKRRRVLGDESG